MPGTKQRSDDVVGPGRSSGRPAVLSRAAIVAAASTFDNVDAITMRQLAERLNVSHGALYRWIRDRDALFDLISETVVDRVLDDVEQSSTDGGWRDALRSLAEAIRDRFLAVPGYASHLARPHPHHDGSVERLRAAGVRIFQDAGADPEMSEQSWLIFLTSLIGWLATTERAVLPGAVPARFDLLIEVLARGLPAGTAAAADTPVTSTRIH